MVAVDSVVEQIAESAWYRLQHARCFGVRLGEETLTDLLVLECAGRLPLHTRVFQTTKAEEAIRGADLEVHIRVGRGVRLKLLIQAKKIEQRRQRYASLNPLVGKTARRQIDVLEDYARQIQARPLYLLYNYVTYADKQPYWHCGRELEEQQLGCTLVPSARIRDALVWRGLHSFHWIHLFPDAMPWRCMFNHCPKSLDRHTPCATDPDARVHWLRLLSELSDASDGDWPRWLWDRPTGSRLSEQDLIELHGGHDVRLSEEPLGPPDPASDEATGQPPRTTRTADRPEPPRVVPHRVFLVDPGDGE